MGGRACIFNRTIANAKALADKYGFEYAVLSPDALLDFEVYSDIIIQTTSVGAGSDGNPDPKNDPIYFYNFRGTEYVYDIIYNPEVTPMMNRAIAAGCRVANGKSMLRYQGYRQFKIFTGVDYGDDTD